MFIKIYFNEKSLFLCDAPDTAIEEYLHHDDTVYIDELDNHTVKTMLHEMQQEKVHAGVFVHPDFEALRKAFFKKFTHVYAGGGLVESASGHYLLIHRRGKWDLPKGKLDEGEALDACSLREVEEETGLTQIMLKELLLVTYHTYHEGTRFILKETHWYRMQVKGNDPLVPQLEEDITEARWVTREDIPQYLPNAFPSVRDVLKAGLDK